MISKFSIWIIFTEIIFSLHIYTNITSTGNSSYGYNANLMPKKTNFNFNSVQFY